MTNCNAREIAGIVIRSNNYPSNKLNLHEQNKESYMITKSESLRYIPLRRKERIKYSYLTQSIGNSQVWF